MTKKNVLRNLFTPYTVYGISSFALLLFSFTQVDLTLTLSKYPLIRTIQSSFQHIGFFERPTATVIFVVIIGLLYVSYWGVISSMQKHPISGAHAMKMIGILMMLLVFSYPAFSADIFNYVFTAKTVVFYERNPYTTTPLWFAGTDFWVNVMRWTHRGSAYAPLWILMTIPAYVLGLGHFLLTMYSMKIFIAAFYLLTAWGIYRMVRDENREYAVLGMIRFALHPLVVIECLVSAHNDIVMMAVALWAIYIAQKKNGDRMTGLFLLSVSAAIKSMSVALLPFVYMKNKRKFAVVIMSVSTALFITILQREMLPWYMIWILPLLALTPMWEEAWIVAEGVSIGLILRYVPVLYYGDYSETTQMIRLWFAVIPIVVSCIVVGIKHIARVTLSRV